MTISSDNENSFDNLPLQNDGVPNSNEETDLPALAGVSNEADFSELPALDGGVAGANSLLGRKVMILRGTNGALRDHVCAMGKAGRNCCLSLASGCTIAHGETEEKVSLEAGVYLRTGEGKLDLGRVFPLKVLEVLDEEELILDSGSKAAVRAKLERAEQEIMRDGRVENDGDDLLDEGDEEEGEDPFSLLDGLLGDQNTFFQDYFSNLRGKLVKLEKVAKAQATDLLKLETSTEEREDELVNLEKGLASAKVEFTKGVNRVTNKTSDLWNYTKQLAVFVKNLDKGGTFAQVSIGDQDIAGKLLALENKVRTLESSDKDGTVTVGTEVFSGWRDLLAKVNQSNSVVSHGGFFDVITILEDLLRVIKDNSISQEEFAKYRNELQKAQLTEEENARENSLQRAPAIPEVFGKHHGKNKKSSKGKSELGGLAAYTDFRNKLDETGLAYDISKHLSDSSQSRRYAVENCYASPDQAFFKNVAIDALQKSEDFLRKMVTWIDTTFEMLVNRGQSEEDVWHLISKIIKAIFEDIHRSRKMITLHTRGGHETRAAQVIFSSMVCVKICESYTKLEFKNHPMVTGTSNNWLIANSGRKEAQLAMKKVETLEAKCASMEKEAAAAKKEASLAKSLAEKLEKELSSIKRDVSVAKSTADKALSKHK